MGVDWPTGLLQPAADQGWLGIGVELPDGVPVKFLNPHPDDFTLEDGRPARLYWW